MVKKNKAAFFDRDGTLIEDVNYLSNLEDIKILPGIVDLCLFLQKEGYQLFVVTNQSGVARGYFDEVFVKETHFFLKDIFERKNIYFKKMYHCPHHPTQANNSTYMKSCLCRKPNPGMLLKAAVEFDLNLSESLMFGDKISDIEAGQKAGCKSFYIQDFLFDLNSEERVEKIRKNLEKGISYGEQKNV